MIVLKHLAREFGLEPAKLRRLLRAYRGKTQGGRWRWEENDQELKKIKEYLTSHIRPHRRGHQSGGSSSVSKENIASTTTTHSMPPKKKSRPLSTDNHISG